MMTDEQFGKVIREWKGRIESLRVPQTKKRKKKMINETIENRVSGISKSLPFTTSVGPSARMTLQGSMAKSNLPWLLPLAAISLVAGYLVTRGSRPSSPHTFIPWFLLPGYRVLLLGSSSALGMQPHFESLCKSYDIECVTRGKNGSTAIGWAGSIEAEIEAARPNTLVVVLGGNDSATTYTSQQHASAISTFQDVCRAKGVNLYWVLPFNLPWPDNFSPLVRAAGVRVFETSQAGIQMGADGVHATPSGYKRLSQMVFEDLQSGPTANG